MCAPITPRLWATIALQADNWEGYGQALGGVTTPAKRRTALRGLDSIP
jgi:hypothetical protein